MPLTFIDIERQKNWRIALFFLVLMAVYLGAVAAVGAAFLPGPLRGRSGPWIFLGLAAATAASIHFWFSASDTVNSVMRRLDARPPDQGDEVHRVLLNVMDELRIVMGAPRTIHCFVIPSLSLNALAVADLRGNAAIAVTEGLLSRLSRSQIEAVVAHEAHHILSGDCLETTVAASIFGTFSAAMEQVRYTSRNRLFASPAFLLAWLLLQLGNILNLFISREREYRADAASVRMTRNPLALAETLHLLSRGWRGSGFIGSGLEMLCIVNPQATALDETEGFVPDLLSTHPPIRQRIAILLRMARVSMTELDARADRRATAGPAPSPARYYARNPREQWQGPFTFAELAALPWLTPLTWTMTGPDEPANRAWKDPAINGIFTTRLSGTERNLSTLTCPSCRQPLATSSAAGTLTHRCVFCAGTLVENNRIPRIIARTGRSGPCSDRINRLARITLEQNRARFQYPRRTFPAGAGVPLLSCPKCTNPMARGFYSMAHLVEVDRCGFCGLTWFDQDELEVLQCMIENRLTASPLGAGSTPGANEETGA